MKVNINKLKNGGSTPKLKQSLIERPKQDKKVIPGLFKYYIKNYIQF